MITCVVEYVIVPAKIDAFERFGRRWMELVDSHGGMHHGYFLPVEGASDKALALFSFPSLAAYEQYRAPVRHRSGLHRSRPHQGRQRLRAPLRTDLHAAVAARACGRVSSPRGDSATRVGGI
jgi:hypothetical protein